MGKGGSTTGSLVNAIKTPLGVVLMLVICIVMAGLSIASAISGQLTAAAVRELIRFHKCSWPLGCHSPGCHVECNRKGIDV